MAQNSAIIISNARIKHTYYLSGHLSKNIYRHATRNKQLHLSTSRSSEKRLLCVVCYYLPVTNTLFLLTEQVHNNLRRVIYNETGTNFGAWCVQL